MANNKELITGEIFNITLPATKSVVEDHSTDRSKNSSEFRNLDANFLIDNGYIRFYEETNSCNPTDFIEMVIRSLRNNLFKDPNHDILIVPLTDDEWRDITAEYDLSETERNINIPLVIGYAREMSELNVVPGSHHVTEAIIGTPNVNTDRRERLRENLDSLQSYRIEMYRDDYLYIVPNLLRKVEDKGGITWYKVIDGRSGYSHSTHNFKNFDRMIDEYSYIFANMLNTTDIPWIENDELDRLRGEFVELQERGWGQLMSVEKETLNFRVRSIAVDSIIIMGDPSLYEAMYEVVYYHDMSNRVRHSNYNSVDRFEIRTSGFIARRRNDIYTAEIYKLCTNGTNNEEDFTFDVMKISSYLRTMSLNDTIKRWYPKEVKEEITGLCLNDIKKYSTIVFRYRMLDKKNLIRMAMVEDWINELDIKGGFVISDLDAADGSSRKNGYLIISGEAIYYGHNGRTGDLNTFMNRYDSFHWKRVRRFTERDSDILFDVDYSKLPESYFAIDHDTLESNETYAQVREVLSNF